MSALLVMTWKKAFILLTVTMAASWGVLAYIYVPPIFLYAPEGKYRIAMVGRSVMGQWFRYWNWPSLLRRQAMRFGVPIPHSHYVKDGCYLDYVEIAPPSEDAERSGFGSRTMQSLRERVSGGSHDALFFKFCFVDFGDRSVRSEADRDAHLARLQKLTREVHEFAKAQKIRLVLGNALPVLDGGAKGQEVRKAYNRWLAEYAKSNPDILVFDFFGPLSEGSDTLSTANAVSPTNSHLSCRAYRLLDKGLSQVLGQLKQAK